MHHKRMHDKDRDLVINKAKERLNERKKQVKSKTKSLKYIDNGSKEQRPNWQQTVLIQNRGSDIRGRIQTKKIRARTRWASVVGG